MYEWDKREEKCNRMAGKVREGGREGGREEGEKEKQKSSEGNGVIEIKNTGTMWHETAGTCR